MIHAGRQERVRTLADLARRCGVKLATYQTVKPYAEPGFPAPVSSPGSRTLLFDGDQVDAYLDGAPIPVLPQAGGDDDLLDRRECAELLGVSPRSWDSYKGHELVAPHLVVVGGVEHWPRHAVAAFQVGRSKKSAGGRPKRVGDQVPREQLRDRTAPFLDADPTTAAGVTAELGGHRDTAQAALTQLRAERIADVLDANPSLTPTAAAEQLGYPAALVRRAPPAGRSRPARPRLRAVPRRRRPGPRGGPLGHRGYAPAIQHLPGDVCAAAVVRDGPHTPAPALVWDERYGWRTSPSRRHPLGKDTADRPAGEGIRYLAEGVTPRPRGRSGRTAPCRSGARATRDARRRSWPENAAQEGLVTMYKGIQEVLHKRCSTWHGLRSTR
ncbi:hypothetical protein [Streptomyces sp. NPDC050848]|uniref:hypothetical protein n=1 Tax=Streptomyces sp. NPDC050848 TaxID=3155791 RepID=UPI0033EDF3A9